MSLENKLIKLENGKEIQPDILINLYYKEKQEKDYFAIVGNQLYYKREDGYALLEDAMPKDKLREIVEFLKSQEEKYSGK